jgi:dTMP kinase
LARTSSNNRARATTFRRRLRKANFAIAGVFIARLLPAVFLGPIAGVIADKLDRRKLMVNCDILRTALYISIQLQTTTSGLYTAMILVECITLFWSPAKEASVPNLVPREKLESANQVSLLAAYGTAPVAALIFTFLSLFTSAINAAFSLNVTAVDLALYANALSFAFAAFTIWGLREIPKGAAAKHAAENWNHQITSRRMESC